MSLVKGMRSVIKAAMERVRETLNGWALVEMEVASSAAYFGPRVLNSF